MDSNGIITTGFSGFSVDDVPAARVFYGDVLGLEVEGEEMLQISIGPDTRVLVYPKGEAHRPASFTILNFPVPDVAAAVAHLRGLGVEFETYEGTPMAVDADGVFRKGGPEIAWFTDPAGNVLSLIAE